MALALLDLVGFDRGRLRFTVDTGTSRYFQLKVGRAASQHEGFDWVDEVTLTTPIRSNDAGGSLLKTTKDVAIPAPRFDHGDVYVQLVSYKTPDGKSPAYSRVVHVPSAPNAIANPGFMLAPTSSVSSSMSTTIAQSFQTPRRIACPQSPDEYAQQASIEDVLGQIVKVAGPVVLELLGGNKSGGSGQGQGTSSDSGGVSGVLSFLLKTLLSGLQAPAPGGGAAAPQKAAGQSLSLSTSRLGENRFAAARRTQWSQPFIFGIDDALIGTVLGPFIKVLPELVNAANQGRLQLKQADNKLVSDSLNTVNQRMLMEQLLAAQQKAPAGGQPDIAQLIQLLQQAQASQAAPTKAQSLSAPALPAPAATPSNRAALSFVAADPLPFNGKPRLVFLKGHDLEFKLKFTVAEPVPKAALPRAILTLTFKGGHKPEQHVTVTLKQKNVAPNGVVTFPVTKSDLAALAGDRVIPVIAEIRWPSSQGGRAYSATGSTEIVLVDKYYMRERGQTLPGERELTDMSRFRAFWNKVWEAPALDAATGSNGAAKKRLWELNADARYLVVLSPDQTSNGLMETKLRAPVDSDPDSLSAKTEGKLKAGIELSLSEVNKLCSLWNGQASLDGDHLAAFQGHAVTRANSGEFLANLKLKGRAGERGMVWVVPVFQLTEFTLSNVQKTDDAGQVVAVGDETVRFPMPVSARILGLKSATGEE